VASAWQRGDSGSRATLLLLGGFDKRDTPPGREAVWLRELAFFLWC